MYEHTFFTPARLAELWEMFAGIVKLASPAVIISVAFSMVGLLFVLIVVMVRKAVNPDKDDDDRDYDIKHY